MSVGNSALQVEEMTLPVANYLHGICMSDSNPCSVVLL